MVCKIFQPSLFNSRNKVSKLVQYFFVIILFFPRFDFDPLYILLYKIERDALGTIEIKKTWMLPLFLLF